MLKTQIFISLMICSLAGAKTFAITKLDYQNINNTYTDELIEFLIHEDTNSIKLKKLKDLKNSSLSNLNALIQSINITDQNIQSFSETLTTLNTKKINKLSLEQQANLDKSNNSNLIQNLKVQINTIEASIQTLEFEISSIENSRSIIESKKNTQEQLLRSAQNNLSVLERSLRESERSISQNESKIQILRSNINRLQTRLASEQDPSAQQRLQMDINRSKNEVQNLITSNQLARVSLNSDRSAVITERSNINQISNTLQNINIELSGNLSILNSQVSLRTQRKNQRNTLNAQINRLVEANRSLDAELILLNNLPLEIAKTENEISNLKSVKTRQESNKLSSESDYQKMVKNFEDFETQIKLSKEALLLNESQHDRALEEFLALSQQTSMTTNTVTLPGVLALDSITITEDLKKSKQWKVFKGKSASLDQNQICAASTRVEDLKSNILAELLVVKLVSKDGSFSSPFVMITYSVIEDDIFYGALKTDRGNLLNLTRLQSPNTVEKVLLSRYSDFKTIIDDLKNHNRANVEFIAPENNKKIQFSLSGSKVSINSLMDLCKNK